MVAIVHTASAPMPASCRGNYRKVYVLDVPYWTAWTGVAKCNAKGARVVRDFGAQSVGKTPRCAYMRTLVEAEALCRQINGAGDIATAEQLIAAGGSA